MKYTWGTSTVFLRILNLAVVAVTKVDRIVCPAVTSQRSDPVSVSNVMKLELLNSSVSSLKSMIGTVTVVCGLNGVNFSSSPSGHLNDLVMCTESETLTAPFMDIPLVT